MTKELIFIIYIGLACFLGFMTFELDKNHTVYWSFFIGIILLIFSPIVAKMCGIL